MIRFEHFGKDGRRDSLRKGNRALFGYEGKYPPDVEEFDLSLHLENNARRRRKSKKLEEAFKQRGLNYVEGAAKDFPRQKREVGKGGLGKMIKDGLVIGGVIALGSILYFKFFDDYLFERDVNYGNFQRLDEPSRESREFYYKE